MKKEINLCCSTRSSLQLKNGKHVDYRSKTTAEGELVSFVTTLTQQEVTEAAEIFFGKIKNECAQHRDDENGILEWRARIGTIPFETTFSPLHDGEPTAEQSIVAHPWKKEPGSLTINAFDDGGYGGPLSAP